MNRTCPDPDQYDPFSKRPILTHEPTRPACFARCNLSCIFIVKKKSKVLCGPQKLLEMKKIASFLYYTRRKAVKLKVYSISFFEVYRLQSVEN
ncbi:hypothetical protein HanXRQr2_Chr09g0374541 [Helianthus annuus]|uniref:Uncharacterized protein n=1 Tax=Helianthus annuus TaxID=4232 RepID=A0A9K3I3F1_HELAN|nr:hypothetical protein HanXRQr2_Chr09g0374541 [Helianthus annuus]